MEQGCSLPNQTILQFYDRHTSALWPRSCTAQQQLSEGEQTSPKFQEKLDSVQPRVFDLRKFCHEVHYVMAANILMFFFNITKYLR